MLAVTRYTVVELTRRRLLLVFVVLGVLLTVGLGLEPLVVPGSPTGQERSVFLLGSLPGTVGLAVELCALAVGMTVINHDLESGAIVGILTKPLSRAGYALGKLLAAAVLLAVLDALFAAGAILLMVINGGGHIATLAGFFAFTAANVVLLTVLVMMLTVYLNNIVAVVIVLVYSFLDGALITLHALVQNHQITAPLWSAVVTVAYWLVPHALSSNLQRDIVESNMHLHPKAFQGGSALASVPQMAGPGEIAYWLAYLAVICFILYLALRRKQV
ncbi:MAG: hypothetical protein ACREPI_03745 [Candidatus Dormibacterales bacterium]